MATMAWPAAPQECRPLDPHVWRACAGTAVARIPPMAAYVYYFPQGHAEQSTSPPDFSAFPSAKSYFLCRISAVRFLANTDTDEDFARIILDPRGSSSDPTPSSVEDPEPDPDDGGEKGVVGFAKILTPSNANNSGGFSVPRFCADSIFSPLDFNADPPVQTIIVRDVHSTAWQFRHIYRGTPRRHLLTTGWSKFVNSKRLVAGDSVVFVRNRASELFVGVRRTGRFCSLPTVVGGTKGIPDWIKGEGGGEPKYNNISKGKIEDESTVREIDFRRQQKLEI